ncbi:MAG: hypothetical protein ABS58_14970 [Mesorhizobium sp. SCN 65-20]|nr:MAG: hypothetical protein ABS58_14970 [Mesorhizobium sp. SCN 65-20]
MSTILSVRWTIASLKAPQPWLSCSRCGGHRPFACSHKFRVNANGKRLDAWLIYRCTGCDSTWNRPIFERRNRRELDPLLLHGLENNEPELASRLAHDAADLEQRVARVERFTQAAVRKQVLSQRDATSGAVEIRCTVAAAATLRIDRMLAGELCLSRKRIETLAADGRLTIPFEGPKALRRSVRDGMVITLDLSNEADAIAIANAAAGMGRAATETDCP